MLFLLGSGLFPKSFFERARTAVNLSLVSRVKHLCDLATGTTLVSFLGTYHRLNHLFGIRSSVVIWCCIRSFTRCLNLHFLSLNSGSTSSSKLSMFGPVTQRGNVLCGLALSCDVHRRTNCRAGCTSTTTFVTVKTTVNQHKRHVLNIFVSHLSPSNICCSDLCSGMPAFFPYF